MLAQHGTLMNPAYLIGHLSHHRISYHNTVTSFYSSNHDHMVVSPCCKHNKMFIIEMIPSYSIAVSVYWLYKYIPSIDIIFTVQFEIKFQLQTVPVIKNTMCRALYLCCAWNLQSCADFTRSTNWISQQKVNWISQQKYRQKCKNISVDIFVVKSNLLFQYNNKLFTKVKRQ